MNVYRVLCVDDCIDTHELLKEALEPEFEVFGIEDGGIFEEAVEVAEPDLIVMDLLMPKMSGFEILERIKKDPSKAKGIPVVVLSAKRSLENQKKAYDLGAKLYINKPFEPDRMLRNLKMFVQGLKMEPRRKMFKVHELDRKLEMRSSFHESKLKSEFELRKNREAAKSAQPDSARPLQEEADDRAARHISLNRKVPLHPTREEAEEHEPKTKWIN